MTAGTPLGSFLSVLCGLISATAGQEPSFSQTDVFVGGQHGYHTYRIPALVVTREGTALAFCEGRKNNAHDLGNIDILVKRSTDKGQTWSAPAIVHEEGGDAEITIGNPCPIVDSRGAVHLLFTRDNKRLFHTLSTDDGKTWATPVEHTTILDSLDYPLVRIATGPGHGIQIKSGRLVAPIWVSDRERQDRDRDAEKSTYQSGVIYSDDAGKTWKVGQLVPPEIDRLNECTVFERNDGALVLNMRARDAGFRAWSESTDGGLTWSRPELDKNLVCPTCQASALRLSPRQIAFSNPASSKRANMTVRLSRDEGKTWPVSRLIHAGPSGYSDLAATRDETILCLFECGKKAYNEKIVIARISPSRFNNEVEPQTGS